MTHLPPPSRTALTMPARRSRTVCDLRPPSIIRMVFGHYSDLGLSHQKRRILKFYCTLAPLICISLYWYYYRHKTHKMMFTYRAIEYLVHYTISSYTKNKYVNEYYRFIPAVDGAPYSGEMYAKLGRVLLCFPVLEFFEVCIIYTKMYLINNDLRILPALITYYIMCGRVPLMMIFSLLYCRANNFRKVITTGNLNDKKHHVLAYTGICNSLEKSGSAAKLLMCVQINGWFVNMLWVAFQTIRSYKSKDEEIQYASLFIGFVFLGLDTLLVFLPSIMLELAREEIEQSRKYIDDQILTCTDEDKRVELQDYRSFMEHHPLEYKVYGGLALSARLPLALIAVGAQYVVCALQFSGTFSNANATYTIELV